MAVAENVPPRDERRPEPYLPMSCLVLRGVDYSNLLVTKSQAVGLSFFVISEKSIAD